MKIFIPQSPMHASFSNDKNRDMKFPISALEIYPDFLKGFHHFPHGAHILETALGCAAFAVAPVRASAAGGAVVPLCCTVTGSFDDSHAF